MLTEKTREETTEIVERALAAGDIGPLAEMLKNRSV
jgi:hypothetical protein